MIYKKILVKYKITTLKDNTTVKYKITPMIDKAKPVKM
jgi:hypothetical protein